MKQRKIGRGLSSLLGDVTFAEIEENASAPLSSLVVRDINISNITPNPNQPRKEFDESKINELSESIRENGILQPIIVQQSGDKYVIIAGERRYRAASHAGLLTIPCIIRDSNESDTFIISMIENIQRAGLNPVEEALGYHSICTKYDLSHADIARILGKSRTHITNMIGLLTMPKEIQQMLISGELSTGHAKVLKKLSTDQDLLQTASKIKDESLSVRALEKYVNDIMNPPEYEEVPETLKNITHFPRVKNAPPAHNYRKLQKVGELDVPYEVLAMEDGYNANYPHLLHIKHEKNGDGQVIIHYNNIDELRDIMSSMIDMSSVYAK
jgi:ParB family chromosome partitioning protein